MAEKALVEAVGQMTDEERNEIVHALYNGGEVERYSSASGHWGPKIGRSIEPVIAYRVKPKTITVEMTEEDWEKFRGLFSSAKVL